MHGTDIRIELVDMTPDVAQALLATTEVVPHRARSMRRVLGFAAAMKRGHWMITHQPVAVDADGVLIDGQHRLSAVVQAGIPVPMLVAYDVPRDTFAVIDAGTSRTASQALAIAGHTDVHITAAAVRAVLLYDVIGGTTQVPSSEARAQIMTPDILDFLDSDRGVNVKTATSAARSIATNLSRSGIRSWLTAGLAIIYEQTPNDPDLGLRNAFVDALHTGAMLPAGSPILRFRRWLISDTGFDSVNRNYRGTVGIAVLIQTWNAWTQGQENLPGVRFRYGKDAWPIVGEKPDDVAARDAERDALFEADRVALAAQTLDFV